MAKSVMTFRIESALKSKLESIAKIEKSTVSDIMLESVEKRKQFGLMELKIQSMASRIAALEKTKTIPRKRRISVGFTNEEYAGLEQASTKTGISKSMIIHQILTTTSKHQKSVLHGIDLNPLF